MKDMKLSKKELKEYSQPVEADKPRYPYGLRLHINKETFDKLGLDSVPDVGKEFMVLAKASVDSVHASKTMGGEDNVSIDLQIVEMELGDVKKKKNASEILYKGS